MTQVFIDLSGILTIVAIILGICFSYHSDICRKLGYDEKALKYYKIYKICIGYILLWLIVSVLILIFTNRII